MELEEKRLSRGEAEATAKDKTLWRSVVMALCPTGEARYNYGSSNILIWGHFVSNYPIGLTPPPQIKYINNYCG